MGHRVIGASIKANQFLSLADLGEVSTFKALLRKLYQDDGSVLTPYTHGVAGALITIASEWVAHETDSKALWASPRGGALGSNAIWKLVCRHTAAELGVRLTPHDARDAAATTWALEAPGQVAVSRDLLSHSDLRTTQKHYNRAWGVEASRTYAKLVERIKKIG